MALNKKQKKKLLIAGGVIAAAGIGYYLYSKYKCPETPPFGNFPTTPNNCPDSTNYIGWKARGAITQNLIKGINPNWRPLYYGVPKCLILDLMWEIKNKSDWGKELTGLELFRAAEYQAAKQIGAQTTCDASQYI